MKRIIEKKLTILCVITAVIVSAVLCGCSDTKQADDKQETAATAEAPDADTGTDAVQIEASEAETGAPEPYKIGIVFPSDRSAYYAAMMDYCDENYPSDRCEVVCFGSEDDQEIQNALIEEMPGQGYDGIILVPVTPDGAIDAIRKCSEQGVSVITLDRAVTSDDCGVAAHIGTDCYASGETMAELMLKGLEEQIPDREIYNVVELAGKDGTSEDMLMSEGIAGVMDENPKINMLATLECDISGDGAEAAAMDCFEAYGNLDGFICHDDDMALACITACRNQEEKPEGLIICSFGGKQEACTAVKNGDMYSTMLRRYEMVGTAIESLCDCLDGMEIENRQLIPAEPVSRDNSEEIQEFAY